MRWPCGPLEIERGRRREGFTEREAGALAAWSTPQSLERLGNAPVNCLVVTWAEGVAGDEAQQRALAPLITAARQRGLSVVGWVGGESDLRRTAGAASAAGLQAIATESREPVPGFEVLRFRERELGDRSPTDFLGIGGLLWPGLRATVEPGADASTGPTGPPWLDSNAWYVHLARSLVKPKTFWLSFEPPDVGQSVAAASYVQAIADAEVYGGRFVVSLDPHLRAGLADRRAVALETWAAIGRGLAFFGKHRAWSNYLPPGPLGVISDYAGAHQFLSFEVLNLLARQGSLYRLLEKSAAMNLDGLDAVLYVDQAPPGEDLAGRLYAFAEAGGTLITPPGWEERGVPDDTAWTPRFRIFRHGRGRLAVARAEPADPYVLAEDAQLLMSHRHDRLRVFNPGTAQFHYATSGDSRSGVLHVLPFQAPDPRMTTTVWFKHPWAKARAFLVDSAEPAPVARVAVESGIEFQLPPAPVYSALELSD
jgi:hypothetical protein